MTRNISPDFEFFFWWSSRIVTATRNNHYFFQFFPYYYRLSTLDYEYKKESLLNFVKSYGGGKFKNLLLENFRIFLLRINKSIDSKLP